MEVLRGRRLLGILFVFTAAFCLCVLLPFYFCLAFAAAIALSFAIYYVVMKKRGKLGTYRLLYIILSLAALLLGIFHGKNYSRAAFESLFTEEAREYIGIVESVEGEADYYSVYTISIDENGRGLLCLCNADYGADFEVGDKVSVFGRATPDVDIYYRSKDVVASICFTESRIIDFGETSPDIFERIQSLFSSLFEKNLEGDALSLANAMLLGDRDGISGGIKLDFRRIGFSHVLAVSGLHISVLVFALMLILSPIQISKRIKMLLLIPVICAFAMITGASASVVRSCIMFICLALSSAFFADSDAPTSLMLAISMIFVFSPSSVYDIGLWLSFSATLGIVIFAPVLSPIRISNTRRTYSRAKNMLAAVLNYIISLVLTAVVATAFTLPVVFICYGGFSLVTPLASLFLIPIVQILLPIFLLLLVFSGIPMLCTALASVATALVELMLGLAGALAELDGIYISLKYPFAKYFIMALLVLIFVFIFGKRVNFRRAIVLFAAIAVAFGVGVAAYENSLYDKAQTVVLNNEKNDGVVIRYGGRTVAVDVSGGSYSFARSMSDEVYALNGEKIDLLIYSHLHRYHATALDKLCSSIKIASVAVPLPQTEAEREYLHELSEKAASHNIEVFVYGADAYADIGDMRIMLPEYLRIKRSTHRIPYFAVDISGERKLFYIGAGLSELPKFYAESNDAQYRIYGSHGAKYKTDIIAAQGSLILGCAAEYIDGEGCIYVSDGRHSAVIE